jgi:Uma2 family endonuclease
MLVGAASVVIVGSGLSSRKWDVLLATLPRRPAFRQVGAVATIRLWLMPTLVLDPQPPAVEALLEQRRQWGVDRRDEVWEGVLHMIPPPSVEHERLSVMLARLIGPLADTAGLAATLTIGIGTDAHNYRVPDLALLRPGYAPQWNETAALVAEIISPGDKSREKLPYYAAHQVDEVLLIDPAARTVEWLAREDDGYRPVTHSGLIDVGVEGLMQQLGWPPPLNR